MIIKIIIFKIGVKDIFPREDISDIEIICSASLSFDYYYVDLLKSFNVFLRHRIYHNLTCLLFI